MDIYSWSLVILNGYQNPLQDQECVAFIVALVGVVVWLMLSVVSTACSVRNWWQADRLVKTLNQIDMAEEAMSFIGLGAVAPAHVLARKWVNAQGWEPFDEEIDMAEEAMSFIGLGAVAPAWKKVA